MSGSCIRACAIPTLLLKPLDKVSIGLCHTSFKFICSAMSDNRVFNDPLLFNPLILPTKDKNSETSISEYDGAPSGR